MNFRIESNMDVWQLWYGKLSLQIKFYVIYLDQYEFIEVANSNVSTVSIASCLSLLVIGTMIRSRSHLRNFEKKILYYKGSFAGKKSLFTLWYRIRWVKEIPKFSDSVHKRDGQNLWNQLNCGWCSHDLTVNSCIPFILV